VRKADLKREKKIIEQELKKNDTAATTPYETVSVETTNADGFRSIRQISLSSEEALQI
jgi:hypothetical protein